MIKKYYSIYDNLAQQFLTPVLFDNDNMALRWFKGVVNDSKNETIYNNPEDYEFYLVGSFNFSTGEVIGENVKLVDGKAVKNEGK